MGANHKKSGKKYEKKNREKSKQFSPIFWRIMAHSALGNLPKQSMYLHKYYLLPQKGGVD